MTYENIRRAIAAYKTMPYVARKTFAEIAGSSGDGFQFAKDAGLKLGAKRPAGYRYRISRITTPQFGCLEDADTVLVLKSVFGVRDVRRCANGDWSFYFFPNENRRYELIGHLALACGLWRFTRADGPYVWAFDATTITEHGFKAEGYTRPNLSIPGIAFEGRCSATVWLDESGAIRHMETGAVWAEAADREQYKKALRSLFHKAPFDWRDSCEWIERVLSEKFPKAA